MIITPCCEVGTKPTTARWAGSLPWLYCIIKFKKVNSFNKVMLYLKEAMEEFYIVQAVDGFDAHQGCLVNRTTAKTKKKRKPCMESVERRNKIITKWCMESRQRREWNQCVALYGINPKEKYTLPRDAMPSHCDGFHTPHSARWFHANPSDWMKKALAEASAFFWLPLLGSNQRHHD